MALAGCLALVCVPLDVCRTICRAWRAYECQTVAMSRLKLTLAHWHKAADVGEQVLRADMRASGNGAVFNTMQQPILISDLC
jgi:hypothetical protein